MAMRIELRRVEHSPALSRETNAFSADVWIDGRKEGCAYNQGQGGCTEVEPDALRLRLDVHGRAQPARTLKPMGNPTPLIIQPDAEWIVDQLLEDWIVWRDMKRGLRRRLIYTKPGLPGLYQSVTLKPEEMRRLLASEEVRARWQVEIWLNTLPEAEALALYHERGCQGGQG